MKKLKIISLNLIGIIIVLALFNIPAFQKAKPQLTKSVTIQREMPQMTKEHPETIEEMKDDMDRGMVLRELGIEDEKVLTTAEGYRIRPLTPLPVYEEYPAVAGEELEEAPPEYGEPRNGDPHKPIIVQVINTISNNFTKIMGGLVALSQALLNFKTFRNRKKVT